jgi:hypothetical protein
LIPIDETARHIRLPLQMLLAGQRTPFLSGW